MEKECNYLEAKIAAKTGELAMSHQHVMELKTKHRSTNDMANQKQKKTTDELGLMQEFIEEMALEVKQSKRKAKSEQKKAALMTVYSKKRLEALRKLKLEVCKQLERSNCRMLQ